MEEALPVTDRVYPEAVVEGLIPSPHTSEEQERREKCRAEESEEILSKGMIETRTKMLRKRKRARRRRRRRRRRKRKRVFVYVISFPDGREWT
eukprot:381398-Hanusia_phi.AAC.3